MPRAARMIGSVVIAAMTLAAAACTNGDDGGGGDANYRMACPPPLAFDDQPYREVSPTTHDIPLGSVLGSTETLGCGDESGEEVPPERVTVHEVVGLPTTSAVATIVDGKLHLYVASSVPPDEHCRLQFVTCPSASP